MAQKTDIKFSKAVNSLLNQILQGIKVFSIAAKGNVDKFDKFVVFKRQGLSPLTSKDRITNKQTATYEVNVYAKEFQTLLEIAQNIIDELEHSFYEDIDNYQINNISLNDISEDFNDEYGLYVFSLTLDFVYAKKHKYQ